MHLFYACFTVHAHCATSETLQRTTSHSRSLGAPLVRVKLNRAHNLLQYHARKLEQSLIACVERLVFKLVYSMPHPASAPEPDEAKPNPTESLLYVQTRNHEHLTLRVCNRQMSHRGSASPLGRAGRVTEAWALRSTAVLHTLLCTLHTIVYGIK